MNYRPAADVHHRPAAQLAVLGHLPHGVLGEAGVEPLRIGLFGQEQPEQPTDRSRPERAPIDTVLINRVVANQRQQTHADPRRSRSVGTEQHEPRGSALAGLETVSLVNGS